LVPDPGPYLMRGLDFEADSGVDFYTTELSWRVDSARACRD